MNGRTITVEQMAHLAIALVQPTGMYDAVVVRVYARGHLVLDLTRSNLLALAKLRGLV